MSLSKKVIGIDENGLGPILGPLVVTGILMEKSQEGQELLLEKFPLLSFIKDSKQLYRRNKKSYAQAEEIVQELLHCLGITADSFPHLLNLLNIKQSPFLMEMQDIEIPLPVWTAEPPAGSLEGLFSESNLRIRSIFSEFLLPYEFNLMLEKYQNNKFILDINLFLKVIDKLTEGEEEVFVGKIGGRNRYHCIIDGMEGFTVTEVLEETKDVSSYIIKKGKKVVTLHFIKDGDGLYLPIALASIVGKYIRELFMLALNRSIGYEDIIPFASGYPADKKTYLMIEEIKKRYRGKANLFIRAK